MKVFICYAHADEAHRNALEAHLALLKRRGVVDVWHDRLILAGAAWEGAIDENLSDAQIVLLLISADFIASNYCWEKEMAHALARHERGEATVIPIIVRACDWHNAPFAELQALPRDGKPITQWADVDTAWTDVVRGIRRATEPGSRAQEQTKIDASSKIWRVSHRLLRLAAELHQYRTLASSFCALLLLTTTFVLGGTAVLASYPMLLLAIALLLLLILLPWRAFAAATPAIALTSFLTLLLLPSVLLFSTNRADVAVEEQPPTAKVGRVAEKIEEKDAQPSFAAPQPREVRAIAEERDAAVPAEDPDDPPPPPPTERTFIYAEKSPPRSLNPAHAKSAVENRFAELLFDSLFSLHEPRARMAQSFTLSVDSLRSDDRKRMLVRLRD